MSEKRKRETNGGIRKLCGCPRRKWAKCEHPWHFNFAHEGEHYRFTLERQIGKIVRRQNAKGQWRWYRDRAALGERITTKTDAEREANRLKVAIEDGTLIESTDRPVLATLTLSQLLKLYDKRYLSVERAAPDARRV